MDIIYAAYLERHWALSVQTIEAYMMLLIYLCICFIGWLPICCPSKAR